MVPGDSFLQPLVLLVIAKLIRVVSGSHRWKQLRYLLHLPTVVAVRTHILHVGDIVATLCVDSRCLVLAVESTFRDRLLGLPNSLELALSIGLGVLRFILELPNSLNHISLKLPRVTHFFIINSINP